MEYRQLGGSGFKVPVLTLGTATFGGSGDLFSAFGTSDVTEAARLVDISLEAELTMFDSADVYSEGRAEEILGKAIAGRRDKVLVSTKATFRLGDGPNDVGSSRFHLIRSMEARLKRLRTDYIDLFQLHLFSSARLFRTQSAAGLILVFSDFLHETGRHYEYKIKTHEPAKTWNPGIDCFGPRTRLHGDVGILRRTR